ARPAFAGRCRPPAAPLTAAASSTAATAAPTAPATRTCASTRARGTARAAPCATPRPGAAPASNAKAVKERTGASVYTHMMRMLALWLPLLGIAHAQKPEPAATGLVAKV